jgi:hypothetical protein
MTQHRRIIHLEFCGLPELPGGVRWHKFVNASAIASSAGEPGA